MFWLWRFRRDVVADRRRDVPRSLSKLKERIEQPGMPTESEFHNRKLIQMLLKYKYIKSKHFYS